MTPLDAMMLAKGLIDGFQAIFGIAHRANAEGRDLTPAEVDRVKAAKAAAEAEFDARFKPKGQ